MQVFITGVAGFIGSNLADRLLAEGMSVRGMDDLSAGLRSQVSPEVDFIEDDITTADLETAMRGADVVFHLCAYSSVTECQRHVSRAAAIQVVGTARVLEAMAATGVRRILAAETSAVYEGTAVRPTPETEEAPQTFYAITKRCTGQLIHAFAKKEGLAATTFRYFNVYGPKQDYRRAIAPVIPAFIRDLILGNTPTIYGDGTKARDFIHVDDVNDFHLLALDEERTVGRVFNLGTGRVTTVSEILRIVEALVGVSVTPVYQPDETPEAPFTQADITRARSVGWEPKIVLEDGIASCLEQLPPELQEARQAAGSRIG
jgi:UDP-glucose 4-epimerase